MSAALGATGTEELAERAVDELSGGQRQRVWIAMALAQEAELLLLEEPTTFLDIAHQIDVLGLLLHLNSDQGRTVVVVLRDLNLACRHASHVIAMRDGRIVAADAPSDVIDAESVGTGFGLESLVIDDPICHTPLVIPIGSNHTQCDAHAAPAHLDRSDQQETPVRTLARPIDASFARRSSPCSS